MSKEKVLIIDGQHIGYLAFHSMGELSKGELKTGVVFGFLREMLKLAKRFETNRFVFCWDSRANHRKKIYDAYKDKRHNDLTDQERKERALAKQQFKDLRSNVLPRLGFKNIYIKHGYEADDLMAILCGLFNGPSNDKYDLILVTSDEDMYQVLEMADIYKVAKKQLYTKKDFIDEYNINPGIWDRVKAIAGCSGDEVTGIKGVGEKTAIKYLNHELSEGSKKYRAITSPNGKRIIKRNQKIVRLPLRHLKLKPYVENEKFKRNDFIDVFEDYAFRSFLTSDEFEKWVKYFKLKR